jgi:hypothetical protein
MEGIVLNPGYVAANKTCVHLPGPCFLILADTTFASKTNFDPVNMPTATSSPTRVNPFYLSLTSTIKQLSNVTFSRFSASPLVRLSSREDTPKPS